MSIAANETGGKQTTRPPKPAYVLTHDLGDEPDAWTVRENLHDILARELVGPLHGEEEVIEASPKTAYLVGVIAPAKLKRPKDDDPESRDLVDDSAEDGSDLGDARDADDGRGVPITAVEDSGAGADEDTVDDEPQRRGLMIPASMGLRFQVPADLAEFTVTASWGVYHPAKRKLEEDAAERPRGPRYQRTPVAVAQRIRPAELTPGETRDFPLLDDVVLRVDCYPERRGGADRLLVEVVLCNDTVAPRTIPINAWLFQARLDVAADATADPAPFLPVSDVLTDDRYEPEDELRRLNLQYRDRLQFALGRTCSVDWTEVPDTRRASRLWTTWLPVSETPQTTVGEADDSGVVLDMVKLAKATREQLRGWLTPVVDGYAAWLDGRETAGRELPTAQLREDAGELVTEARRVLGQIRAGLDHLLDERDDEPVRCFRFMNEVMAEQRIQTQAVELRSRQPELSIDAARAEVRDKKGEKAHSWRAFQLAFILMQLPLLTDPAAPGRSSELLAKTQLLFFPTGGGKTEAYLGLAAYTFAIRRRQGVLDTADGQLDGRTGVGVLMRYTLRLLTAQQFQRATAMVCAAELIRRDHPDLWSDEPFRIGLWVGLSVSPKRWEDANEQLTRAHAGTGSRLSVLQVERCPWCATRIEAGDLRSDEATRRVRVFCGDQLGECPFSRGATDEGLPVLTVDEEIYRLAPDFLIATVDKFARLAREGEAAALFGYVREKCEKHGYVHHDYVPCSLQPGSKHKGGGSVRPVPRLRPPDLIIQDELHLITGALGTTVGLFEAAVDVLCSWRDRAGNQVRPLVVASTATARNATGQVTALYGRGTTVFPPQVLDVGRTYFSAEQEITPASPGRRYVGISTTGVRLTAAEIRVSEILLAGGQLMLERAGAVADPYLTLVAYFNATRELAGMARYLADDVQTLLRKGRPWSSLPRRFGTTGRGLHVAELTSRVSSREITSTLDQMKVGFDPAFDSHAARVAAAEASKTGGTVPRREVAPYDAVLATSMLQVGVDVGRLGLMVMVGQPKNTAEYIQASSRVGREADKPGLVVSLGNWARPRDLAHFEQFRHYHETFYSQVEALSVTPYSATNLDRGLDGVLVSAARVRQADRADGLSPEKHAGKVEQEEEFLRDLAETLVARMTPAAEHDDAAVEAARIRLANRIDQWLKRLHFVRGQRKALYYERVAVAKEGEAAPLLVSAEDHKAGVHVRDEPPFVVANSMREVQPEINLLVSPLEERLYRSPVPGEPVWKFPPEKGAGS